MAPTTVFPPMPSPTALTRHFWEGAAAHRLVFLRCEACGFWLHPPRPICRRCRSWDVAPAAAGGRGSLYTYTVTETAFHPYWADKLPYVVAVVTLEEQPDRRVITNVIDCREDELRVGLPLEVTYVEAAPGLTLPVFRPAA